MTCARVRCDAYEGGGGDVLAGRAPARGACARGVWCRAGMRSPFPFYPLSDERQANANQSFAFDLFGDLRAVAQCS